MNTIVDTTASYNKRMPQAKEQEREVWPHILSCLRKHGKYVVEMATEAQDMKEKIVDALLEYASTKEGHETLVKLLDIDNFVRSTDADYEVVRQTLKAIGKDASELVK